MAMELTNDIPSQWNSRKPAGRKLLPITKKI